MSKYSFLLLLFLAGCDIAIGDYVTDLSGDYIYYEEGPNNKIIAQRAIKPGTYYIPCNVEDYDYNKNFIIAIQQPQKECVVQDTTVYTDKTQKCFWIIVHKTNQFFGPLTLKEYLQKRKDLNIPSDLEIKLK